MRRIVAPAGTALSALLNFERASPYLIDGILELG